MLSFDSTRLGSNGTRPVAAKVLWTIDSLNESLRADGKISRKSSFSIMSMPNRVYSATRLQ